MIKMRNFGYTKFRKRLSEINTYKMSTLRMLETVTSTMADKWHTITSLVNDRLGAYMSMKKKCSTRTKMAWKAR
jgi:hypothetical protein